ncbi:MAG: pyruvate ferredoxin oxidoreductase [Clostridia bacterium]|nr:pyruvate ferredoxin oxidoreductase [Clostridia bacterium]
MIEIRWHGRGGHGGFTAARLLGLAASVYGGNYAQAFPSFGPERRGAHVLGFTRIDSQPINDHSQVYNCDYVIVLDETLMETFDVTKGIKEGGLLLINSSKLPQDFNIQKNIKVHTLNAGQIAEEVLGVPIVNTVMLGAIAALTGIVELDAVYQAIDEVMAPEIRDRNKKAVEVAYNSIKGVSL